MTTTSSSNKTTSSSPEFQQRHHDKIAQCIARSDSLDFVLFRMQSDFLSRGLTGYAYIVQNMLEEFEANREKEEDLDALFFGGRAG